MNNRFIQEGKGTSYRVDPKAVVKVLPFLTAKKQTGQEQVSLESGKYHLTLDVPAMADKGPIKAEATVRIDRYLLIWIPTEFFAYG